jgi:hypothetical protein
MDPKSIVLYFHRKSWTAQDRHDDLVATLYEEAIAYSTMTKYLHEAQINGADAAPMFDATSPRLDESDEAI